MRRLVPAGPGLVIGAGVTLGLAMQQTAIPQAVDRQGRQLMGVIFVAIPVGAVPGASSGCCWSGSSDAR